MKKVVLYTVKCPKRSEIAKRINRETGANVIVVDEIVMNKDFAFTPEAVVICIGRAEEAKKLGVKNFEDGNPDEIVAYAKAKLN